MKKSSSKSECIVNLSPKRMDLISELLVQDLQEILREGVRGWVLEGSKLLAQLLINAEVIEKVGERNQRNADRDCVRWGFQDGSIYVMEQKVPVRKARIRTKDGASEVALDSYVALQDKTVLNEQAAGKMLSGMSTRRFAGNLEQLLDAKGLSRQTISVRAAEEMGKRLEDFKTRSLVEVEILAVFMDGIHLGDDVYVAAMGVDTGGNKHVLGFEPGSTECSTTCKNLLKSLIERNILEADKQYLFVLDGGKALRKAIKELFGKRAHIQRCIVHKKRNVTAKLPKQMHEWFIQKFNAAYNKKTPREAEAAFDQLRRDLELKRRYGAANSLTEGLQELLTLHKFNISGALRRSLYSTNCIESLFSAARYYTRNVKRWQGEQQAAAWLASGLLEAENNLRRIPGYTQIIKLKQLLKR